MSKLDVRRYRRVPIVLEAVKLSADNLYDVAKWCGGSVSAVTLVRSVNNDPLCLVIPTLEGDLFASVGDFVVKGTKGEFWAVKPDVFLVTYVEQN